MRRQQDLAKNKREHLEDKNPRHDTQCRHSLLKGRILVKESQSPASHKRVCPLPWAPPETRAIPWIAPRYASEPASRVLRFGTSPGRYFGRCCSACRCWTERSSQAMTISGHVAVIAAAKEFNG